MAHTVKADQVPSRGRPRSEASHRAILDAARRLLEEGSLSSLTIEATAAAAGVGKTTIYRRWRTKEALALAVLRDMAGNQVPVPDLGDTRAELVHAVADTGRTMTTTIAGRTIRGLAAAFDDDPELAAEFRSELVALRRAEMARIAERGVRRGDLDPGADLHLLSELVIGPLFWRVLLTGDPVDEGFATGIVDAALRGLAPR